MINNIIDLEKKMYFVPIYNIENLDAILDQNIQLSINDSQFLEVLLLKLRGETIKYASGLKKRQHNEEKQLISEIQTLERNASPEVLESPEEKKITARDKR